MLQRISKTNKPNNSGSYYQVGKHNYCRRLEHKIKRPPTEQCQEDAIGDIRVQLSEKTLTENRLMDDIDSSVKKLISMDTNKLEIFGIGMASLVEGLGYDQSVLINVVNAFSSSISEIGGEI